MSDEIKVERKKIKDFKPATLNPNKGSIASVPSITESVQRAGTGRSGLADKNGQMIAGSHSLQAMEDAGIEDVIVITPKPNEWVIVQRNDLDLDTDIEARALQLADNRLTVSGFVQDDAVVSELLLQIQSEDTALIQATGYDDAAIRALLKPEIMRQPPSAFPTFGEDIHTDYQCPHCSYKWSGKPKPDSE